MTAAINTFGLPLALGAALAFVEWITRRIAVAADWARDGWWRAWPADAVAKADAPARIEEDHDVLDPGQVLPDDLYAAQRRLDCPPWTVSACQRHGLVTIVRPGDGCPECFPPTGGQ